MADIQVRINLNAGVDGDQIDSVAFNQETNNVSKAVGSKTIKNDGQNLISWGEDGLIHISEDGYVGGADATLSEQGGYNGFVFGVVPENKMYSVEVTLEGSNIDSVTFYGDKNANQFPTRAIVNGEYIYSDDAEWTIVFPSASNEQTITFDMWNRANYNACFTHIGVFVNELVLDKKWIKSVEVLSELTGRGVDIYYGVTPSSGKLEILDRNKEIIDYIHDSILSDSNVPVDVYIENKSIVKSITQQGGYNLQNSVFSVNLIDSFNNKLDENFSGYKYKSATDTVLDITKEVLYSMMGYSNEEIETILSEEILISYNNGSQETNEIVTVKDYMSDITMDYPHLVSSTYRDALKKICTLTQLFFAKSSNESLPKFYSARPVVATNNIIDIRKRNIFGNIEKDIFVKNKIETASCEFRQYEVDYNNLGNKYIFIRNSSNGIVSDIDEYPRVLDNPEYNNDLVIIRNHIQDSNSLGNPENYGKEFYSIIRITLARKDNFADVDKMSFKLEAKINLIDILERYEESKNKVVYTFEEENIDIVDNPNGDVTDDDVIQYWLNPINQGYSGEALDIKVRVNKSTYDVYIAFMEEDYRYDGQLLQVYKSYDFTIKTRDLLFKTSNSNSENDINLESNELIQSTTMYKSNLMYNIIENNLKSDYYKGIKSSSLSVCCDDYYYLNGEIAKDWGNMDILNLGDFVKIENDDLVWKIIGRTFRKIGVPMLDLKLQETLYKFTLTESDKQYNIKVIFPINPPIVNPQNLYKSYKIEQNGTIKLLDEASLINLTIGNVVYSQNDNYSITKYEITQDYSINLINSEITAYADVSTCTVQKFYT